MINKDTNKFNGEFSKKIAKSMTESNPSFWSISLIILLMLGSMFQIQAQTPAPFITTWRTNVVNETITIPTSSGMTFFGNTSAYTYNYTIDCGTGNTVLGTTNQTATEQTGNVTCVCSTVGDHDISITGVFPHFYINNVGNKTRLYNVKQWGDLAWGDFRNAFQGAGNLGRDHALTFATDTPNLSNVTSMSKMFRFASAFNGDLSSWNVSNVRNMNSMFHNTNSFNGDLSSWNVSNVTDMGSMFNFAAFNGDINSWNVSNVTNMLGMFSSAGSFNRDLNSWNVSNVRDMSYMFNGASTFNGDISSWNVSNVRDMRIMFNFAYAFNGDLSSWNVSNVGDMSYMFDRAHSFNGDISSWNVSKVIDMNSMFRFALTFNGDLSSWNVSDVRNMNFMFLGVKLSSPNYDALLNGWATQTVRKGLSFHGGNSRYSAVGNVGRNTLRETYRWPIVDGGVNNVPTGLALSANTLAEKMPVGSLIGTLFAMDSDGGEVLTYSVSDTTNFEISGDSLLNKVVFDFETTPSYDLTLIVTDLCGLMATLDTVIRVIDINFENSPTGLALSANTLAENTPVGSFIGTLSATDRDMGDTLTYSVSDETNFEISGDSLLNKVVFDFETTPSYGLTLTVTDLSGFTATLDTDHSGYQ